MSTRWKQGLVFLMGNVFCFAACAYLAPGEEFIGDAAVSDTILGVLSLTALGLHVAATYYVGHAVYDGRDKQRLRQPVKVRRATGTQETQGR